MPERLFRWLALFYRENAYMTGTKIAGVLCSFADIAMIWMFLGLTDAIRGRTPGPGKRRRVLILFALLTPALILPRVSTHFFFLQFFVLGIPYLILAGSVVAEAPHILAWLRRRRNDALHGRDSETEESSG